jgi:glycosyltransferase involved in cell wall biosynthesis
LIYDLYPEALEMAGLVKSGSALTKGIRFANVFMFRALDAIITIGRDVEPLLMRYKGVEKGKIKFIPNWTLLPIRYRALKSDNPFRGPHAEKLIVGLSGNLGFTHSAKTVFETAKLLEEAPDIHFLLSGWGSGWEKLKALHTANHLRNVTLMNPVPNSELEDFLAAADVWVIPYRRNIAGVSVPSRLYNLLAVGRPVIVAAEATSEAALIVQEEDIGWVVSPENPNELANAIRAAASDHAATTLKGRRSAVAALKYTQDRAIARYKNVIGNVLRTGFQGEA